ncbi:hypothetical protein [Vibrio sp. NH-UV-68]|uniref:hypothetical protein n=1 Tax=unclassified Vibrio TaxID=2614977 RepID=UPI0036F42347
MYKATSVLVALLTILVFGAQAEEESDINNRSKLSPDIADMDSNGDGLVSKDEFNQYRLGSSDQEPEEGAEEESEVDNDDGNKLSAFASFDKDKDGFVTQQELDAHAKYSNPGNGTGELKEQKQQIRATAQSDKASESNNRSGSNKGGGNKGGGNKGGSDKGGKGKDK